MQATSRTSRQSLLVPPSGSAIDTDNNSVSGPHPVVIQSFISSEACMHPSSHGKEVGGNCVFGRAAFPIAMKTSLRLKKEGR